MEAVSRKDHVQLSVPVCIPGHKEWLYHFTWKTHDEAYAQMLAYHVNKSLKEKMQEIRQQSYEQGWKDAKAKRKKETWFSGWLG